MVLHSPFYSFDLLVLYRNWSSLPVQLWGTVVQCAMPNFILKACMALGEMGTLCGHHIGRYESNGDPRCGGLK